MADTETDEPVTVLPSTTAVTVLWTFAVEAAPARATAPATPFGEAATATATPTAVVTMFVADDAWTDTTPDVLTIESSMVADTESVTSLRAIEAATEKANAPALLEAARLMASATWWP